MNKVELLATIPANPTLQGEAPTHVTFPATVTHKTRSGDLRSEDYPISAWNGTAQWTLDNLSAGQQVVIYGYLTQKKDRSIEVCATQILLIQKTKKPVYSQQNNGNVGPGEHEPSQKAAQRSSPAAGLNDLGDILA